MAHGATAEVPRGRRGAQGMQTRELVLTAAVIVVPLIVAIVVTLWSLEQVRYRPKKWRRPVERREPAEPEGGAEPRSGSNET